MPDLQIASDAFAHSQIKSKLWMSQHLRQHLSSNLSTDAAYTLNWYGSWVGIGPFILLSHVTELKIRAIHLYDLNNTDLETSRKVLNMWECDGLSVHTHNQDVNTIIPASESNQIFINTSCEHIRSSEWLRRIPSGSFIVLQSTNMPHSEHINCPDNLGHFCSLYEPHIKIIDRQEISFSYPDKDFTRFMLFGFKL